MWLFDESIANIRNRVKFELRLTTHTLARLAGRRVVLTCLMDDPLRAPLCPTQCAEVEAKYILEGRVVREVFSTSDLTMKGAHKGCPHVMIASGGLQQGTIVDISKIEKEFTRVVLKGKDKRVKSNIFTVQTAFLCPVKVVE